MRVAATLALCTATSAAPCEQTHCTYDSLGNGHFRTSIKSRAAVPENFECGVAGSGSECICECDDSYSCTLFHLKGDGSTKALDHCEPKAQWDLAINVNPSDGHMMGYGAAGWSGSNVGSQATALTEDYVSSAVFGEKANYIAIARHGLGSSVCEAVKVFKFGTPDQSFASHMSGKRQSSAATQTYSDVPSNLPDITKDPIFGASGDLVLNWWYSNNGVRIAVNGAYMYGSALPGTGDNTDDYHGLGNEYGADTSNFAESSAWRHDVGQLQGECHGGSCAVMGTDHGSSLYSSPVSYQYAVYVTDSPSMSSFPCNGQSLELVV